MRAWLIMCIKIVLVKQNYKLSKHNLVKRNASLLTVITINWVNRILVKKNASLLKVIKWVTP
jgi:hypothetical protein